MIGRIIVALALIAGLAWASGEDYREALRDQREYCENVRTGYWPDYRGTYEQECGSGPQTVSRKL